MGRQLLFATETNPNKENVFLLYGAKTSSTEIVLGATNSAFAIQLSCERRELKHQHFNTLTPQQALPYYKHF
jgi:hypothetical protein